MRTATSPNAGGFVESHNDLKPNAEAPPTCLDSARPGVIRRPARGLWPVAVGMLAGAMGFEAIRLLATWQTLRISALSHLGTMLGIVDIAVVVFVSAFLWLLIKDRRNWSGQSG